MADHRDDSSLRRDPGTMALVCAQGICAATVVVGLKALPGSDLIGHPVATIQSTLAVTLPAVIVTYTAMTRFTSSPRPIWRSVGDGLLSLPVGCLWNPRFKFCNVQVTLIFNRKLSSFFCDCTGAVIFALLALAFGAPTSLQYASGTLHWACLMSVLAVVPAAIVSGASWPDWQRLFAFTRPRGGLERAVCIPAHGAVIGAWVGAFPMPLDWERPWQEWPISCTFGAAGGYLLGLIISVLLQCLHPQGIRSKME